MAESSHFRRITITLPCALAEAFATSLAELRGGAVEELPGPELDQARLRITAPPEEPTTELDNLVSMLIACFADELGWERALFAVSDETLSWEPYAALTANAAPIFLTERLVLAPNDARPEVAEGSRVLRMIPDMCFGDGTHVTTRLAAQAVEAACTSRPGTSLLDVGTGSGVLALVGALLGAAPVLGIDIDPVAVAAARRNAEENLLSARFMCQPLETIPERFAIVVANLEPRTQLELASAIAERVAPGGLLILTGFLANQRAAIAAPFLALGFTHNEFEEQDAFALQILEKLPICPEGSLRP